MNLGLDCFVHVPVAKDRHEGVESVVMNMAGPDDRSAIGELATDRSYSIGQLRGALINT